MPTDRDPAEIHQQDQVLAAFADVPGEITEQFGEGLGALVVALTERGVSMRTIVGGIHGLVTECVTPLLVKAETGEHLEEPEDTHQHTWGAGLGESFTLGSIEEPSEGMLLQVCGSCGARRRV
jgi:hypothetical protein